MTKAKDAATPTADEPVVDNTLPVEPEPEPGPPAERRYLRSTADGHLFAYTDELVLRPDLEVVTEAEAYPERNMPPHVEDAKAKGGEGVDLAGGITEDTVAEKDPPTDPALAKQAAKGWPK